MTDTNKYRHCMVLGGGGFRFSYYLGMYAAAADSDNVPDLLLATCGGAIAAAVIQSLPDDASRKAWASSPDMYDFLKRCRPSGRAGIGRTIAGAGKRWLQHEAAPDIADLFQEYLFELPGQLPLPPAVANPRVSIAIIGGKLLYRREEVNQPRSGRKLFEETVFGDPRTAGLLRGVPAPAAAPGNAISPALRVEPEVALADAVRVSISDMFYLPCCAVGPEHYIGGVIDLVPIEIARRLANRVTVENKAPFNQVFAIPAIRAVLGIDGNARMRDVRAQHADTWIDTEDVGSALRRHGVGKAVSWRDGRVRMTLPKTHQAYVEQVDAQWQYGYARAMAAFAPANPPGRNNRKAGIGVAVQ